MSGKAHLAAALRWQGEARVEPASILAAALGMAGPVAAGVATGHLPLGLAAAVGGLAVGGASVGPNAKAQVRELGAVLVPAAAAAVAAAAIAGRGPLTDGLLVVLACTAAIAGGYRRATAVATTRFILFLIVTINVAGAAPERVALPILIVAGALWTAAVNLTLGSVARAGGWSAPAEHGGEPAPPAATADQKRARWKKTLTGISGRQYTLRLGICLTVAGILRSIWPEHHLYWIALTAALLCERRIETFPIKTTQRALGTALGVVLAYAFVALDVAAWGLAAAIGVLAGLRSLLRAKNYLAYAIAMTPLIILIMDAGRPLGTGVLIDRLIATLIGAALVITVNVLIGGASSANGSSSPRG